MFLRISRNRRGKNVYEYAQIAERYRENGKQKTRIIEYLGPVRNRGDMDRYGNALEIAREREAMRRTTPDEFSLLPSLDFGVVYASMAIMNSSGILPLLRKSAGVYAHILTFMIVARILEPSSDLSLIKIAERVYYPWAKIDLNDDNIYRTLDKIIRSKEELEVALFNALNPDTSTVHYDLTSTYFEGREDNDLVLFGYSRDKKRGKEQIVIAIVMADGIPIYHEVWPGNTVDPKTLESTLAILKERFSISNVIFIGDRAFGRNHSLNLLDRGKYITAAYRWDHPYRDILIKTDFSSGTVMDDLVMKEVAIDAVDIADGDTTEEEMELIGKRRHIAVFNKEREKIDVRDIDDKIDNIRRKMSGNHSTSDLKKSIGELKSFVMFTKDGAVLNEKHIEMMRKLAGRFLIVTNTDLNEKDAVSAYKEQWEIERSFRTIKSFLEIRPVYHRKSERIKAHVLVCVLSLLTSRMIEKKTGMTISEASRLLSYLKVTPVRLRSGIVMMRSESEIAAGVLKQLGVMYPDRILDGALTE